MDRQTAKLCGEMLDMITGHWKVTFITCAARLGLADHLYGKTMSAEELAPVVGAHAPSLYRLMRALCDLNILTEDQHKRFNLTPLGATLRDGIFKHVVITMAYDEYEPWINLMHCIKTGENGYLNKYGIGYYQHLEKVAHSSNNEEFENFRKACLESTRALCFNIPLYYDFTQFKHIVDLGGNDGTFLCQVLKHAPNAKGTVFDSPAVIAEAKNNVVKNGLTGRMECVSGSFLENVPAGADCYMMKSVYIDWIGEESHKILTNIRKQLKQGGKLILIQSVVSEANAQHVGKFYDLYYLLFTRGNERTQKELEGELQRAGFRLNKIIYTDHPIYTVIESVAI